MELFTEAWAQAYCRKLNESEAYRKAASTWEGSLALAVRPDPKAGFPKGVAVVLDLWHGACRGAKAVEGEAEADFVIEADLATWQEVLEVFQVAAVLSLEALEAWREGLFLASAKALGVVVEPCLP